MEANEWFDCDGDDLSDDQRLFVNELRARAQHWPAAPVDTFIVLPGADSGLVACMDVDAPDEPLSLLTAGIHVSGNRLQGDRLHNQLYTLPDRPTSSAIVADGSMPELAETAAAWLRRF